MTLVVELGVTVLSARLRGTISEPTVAPLTVADHRIYGWHLKSDPVISFDYRY